MNTTHDVAGLLRTQLADPGTGWSLGSFGAIAEFVRDADEECLIDPGLGLATRRGAIRLEPVPELRPFAYETAFGSGWNHAVALCLPEGACAMNGRTLVTELGPDCDAVRPEHRDDVLFDLGLGLLAVDACVRVGDPEAVAALRAGCGLPLFDPLNPIGPRLVGMSPHRVFTTRFGRIEVFQPIPPADGASPEGPHTHVIPKLLRGGRTHAATTPIPDGFVPCAALHPPHPTKDGMGRPQPFDRARYDAFQALLERWGDPSLLDLKRRVMAGGAPGPGETSKYHGLARRAGEAQALALRGEVPSFALGDEADDMSFDGHPGHLPVA